MAGFRLHGSVCSEVLDHTSALRLVEEKWNLPALTARDAAANTPLDALDFTGAPAFPKPPSLPEPGLKWGTLVAGTAGRGTGGPDWQAARRQRRPWTD